MLVEYADFNIDNFESRWKDEWDACKALLQEMPLHLKASDQAGIQGNPIFDPVGTNEYIKGGLQALRWSSNVPIPAEFNFLGTDVDFCVRDLVAEVQFSNYPFLLNNVVRSELFFKSGTAFAGEPIAGAMIITKAHMFPASQSTLYFEQARHQLTALARNRVFDVPLRLVGLFTERDTPVPATWTTYANSRYSRTVAERSTIQCVVHPPTGPRGGRCIIRRVDN